MLEDIKGHTTTILLLLMILSYFGQLVTKGIFGSAYYTVGDFGTLLYYLAPSQGSVLVRPWTLVTSIFMHGSFMSLLINGLLLLFIGRELERRIGSKLAYPFFGAGISAQVVYLLTSPEDIIALGASGAVLGVVGTLVVLTLGLGDNFPDLRSRTGAVWLLALSISIYVAVSAFSEPLLSPEHLITGLAAGLLYGSLHRHEWRVR